MNCALPKNLFTRLSVEKQMCRMNFGFGDACASCVVHARYDHRTLGLKVRLFISSLFIVFAFTKKFLLSHCRYQLSTDEEWIRHNFRYFYSRVSCGASHCRSNVVNLKMMRLHRISDHKNQSHANAIEFVLLLLLLFAGATVVSWRVNNQEQLFVRWVETFTKHFSKHCLSLSSKSKCGMRACKEMRRKCQCNTSFVCCGCRRLDEGKFRSVAWYSSDANLITRCRFLVRQKLNQTEVVSARTHKRNGGKQQKLAWNGLSGASLFECWQRIVRWLLAIEAKHSLWHQQTKHRQQQHRQQQRWQIFRLRSTKTISVSKLQCERESSTARKECFVFGFAPNDNGIDFRIFKMLQPNTTSSMQRKRQFSKKCLNICPLRRSRPHRCAYLSNYFVSSLRNEVFCVCGSFCLPSLAVERFNSVARCCCCAPPSAIQLTLFACLLLMLSLRCAVCVSLFFCSRLLLTFLIQHYFELENRFFIGKSFSVDKNLALLNEDVAS